MDETRARDGGVGRPRPGGSGAAGPPGDTGRSPAPSRDPSEAPSRRTVDALARVLDRAFRIPGTDIRFGLDGLIGLVPGIGDAAGAALSAGIVIAAIRAGASRSVLGRMVANVAFDTVLGAIPVVGDLFDFAWKANARNAALLQRFLDDPAPTRRASAGVVALVVVGLAAILGLGLWAAILVGRALLGG